MFKKLAGVLVLLFILSYTSGFSLATASDRLVAMINNSQILEVTNKFLSNFSNETNSPSFKSTLATSTGTSNISFLYVQDSSPVTLDICKTTPIVVSKKNSKKLMPSLTKVVNYLNKDLGLSFVIIGETSEVASSDWFREGHGSATQYSDGFFDYAPILVSLVNSSDDSDLLKSDSSGGAAITHVGKGPDSDKIVTGAIALNNKVVKLSSNNLDTRFAETVLLHEFSHILGLDHNSSGVLQESLHMDEYYSSYPKDVEKFFKKNVQNCS